jgi:hypothetical protein
MRAVTRFGEHALTQNRRINMWESYPGLAAAIRGMREPQFVYEDGQEVSYSQVDSHWLRKIHQGQIQADGPLDLDFHKRYAAIILRERGQ